MIQAVVFDWAGTTIDYGSQAPIIAFKQAFAHFDIHIPTAEIRQDVGLDKLTHIKKMMANPAIQSKWVAKHPNIAVEDAITQIYQQFQQDIVAVLAETAQLKPGVKELVNYLDAQNIPYASTTGYTQSMLDRVLPLAAKQGYNPKANVTSEQTDGIGRPQADMLLHAIDRLGVPDARSVIKVGDTVNDILEGKASHAISIGVVDGGNLIGLSEGEFDELTIAEQNELRNKATDELEAAGADYVINAINDLIKLIPTINVEEQHVEPEAPILLTPGPLTTSKTVKEQMLVDHGTWDDEYKADTQEIRSELLKVANVSADNYAAVLMQGSGTFAVEATLGTAVPKHDATLMIAINGAYGQRMAQIADYLDIDHIDVTFGEDEVTTLEKILDALAAHPEVTHFAIVHCETTTGILNSIEAIIPRVHELGITTIVDAMSSFGGVPINVEVLGIDYLISSSNKCIQGVPGFGLVIAKRRTIDRTAGNARSLSLDLYEQYKCFEEHDGKWRFTSPTHVVYAFQQALRELAAEGGVSARNKRYRQNEKKLRQGMLAIGYQPVISEEVQSPIITSFKYPNKDFDFRGFYEYLKENGFIIYPGKVSNIDSFRIGNIGQVFSEDMTRLLTLIKKYSVVKV
ncbi:MAG: 2-aminoethylphosphonate--pyruvate transaminase [Lactobacillus sp.]|nr:MAG: 2-aminoethylphosphonate--pyruvate transaminase [Lactobacillus sp.]